MIGVVNVVSLWFTSVLSDKHHQREIFLQGHGTKYFTHSRLFYSQERNNEKNLRSRECINKMKNSNETFLLCSSVTYPLLD